MIPSEKHRFVHLLDTELDSLDLRRWSPTFSPFLLQPHGTSFDFTACFALFRINHRNLINGIRGSFFSSSSMISISLWYCLSLSLSSSPLPLMFSFSVFLSHSLLQGKPSITEEVTASSKFSRLFLRVARVSCTISSIASCRFWSSFRSMALFTNICSRVNQQFIEFGLT